MPLRAKYSDTRFSSTLRHSSQYNSRALTSKNTYKAHIEGLEVGADAYIQKPFSSELLQVQIANLLKNRRKIKDHFASSPFDDVGVMAHSKTDEAWLKKLDDYIRANIKDPNIDIDTLAEHMFMSRTTFYRKIKSLSSLSPKELIDITRLKKAVSFNCRERVLPLRDL